MKSDASSRSTFSRAQLWPLNPSCTPACAESSPGRGHCAQPSNQTPDRASSKLVRVFRACNGSAVWIKWASESQDENNISRRPDLPLTPSQQWQGSESALSHSPGPEPSTNFKRSFTLFFYYFPVRAQGTIPANPPLCSGSMSLNSLDLIVFVE